MPPTGPKASFYEEARQAEQRGNREGRDLWERYGEHRGRLTAAALALAPAGGGPARACFLGAGNANDLDLEALAARFAEVHLVDIDPSALSRAVSRQPAEIRQRLRPHAPVDLTGLFRQLDAARSKDMPAPETLVERGTAEVLAALPRDFDVVTSGCIISQMSWALARVAPDDPDLTATLDQSMVAVHLRTLAGLARPGGAALVVADLISSDRYPLEEAVAETDLRTLMDRLAVEKTAYAGSNPVLIKQLIRRDATLTAAFEPPRVGEPWLWTGSRDRLFLVYPMVLRRR
jgi:hypothetical protein